MVKNNILDIKQASRQLINNIIVGKNFVLKYKPLTIVFLFINILTFNRIDHSTLYKVLYRIRFSRKINEILRDFKIGRIGFKRAKSNLKDIINMRLI